MKKDNDIQKKRFSLFSVLTLVLLVTLGGCKDDDDAPEPTLEINKNTVSFLQTGGSDIFEITTNQSWNITSSPTWLTITPTEGKNDAKITLTATANTDYEIRETTLTVKAGSLVERITVSQPGLEPVLSVNPTQLDFETAGGSEQLAITANVSWSTSLSENANWLSVTPSEDKTSVTVTATPNTTFLPREATLTFTGDQNKEATVTLKQQGPEKKDIAALRALADNTPTDYLVITGIVTSDKDGKNLDEKEMIIQDGNHHAIALQFTGNHNISTGTQVDVLLNGGSRSTLKGLTAIGKLNAANIAPATTATLTVTPLTKTIAEILSGETEDGLLVKIENVEFKSSDQTYAVQPILWNGSEELPLWTNSTAVFREQKVASGNGAVTGHIANYEGWKLLLRNTTDVKEMTNERQYDKGQLKLSVDTYTFGNQGGKFTVDVTATPDVIWTAEVSAGAGWCSLEPSGGTGNGTFVITAEAYADNIERKATITVSASDISPVTLEITQIPSAKREFILSKWANSNLGAKLPATEENILGPDYKDTWGLYYQWGRNVGFPHTGAESVVATNENITAESAQNMPEFITSTNGDWLTASDASATWEERAGSTPCPPGYRLPNQMDLLRIYPSSSDKGTFSNTQSSISYERLEDRPGVPDRTLYAYDGSSKIYAIKKFETADAYILRFEILGEMGKNLYLKITEILGDENTIFDNATDAEALFAAATESEVRIFPLAGMLNYEDGKTLQAPGAAAWYWMDKKRRCLYMLNTKQINEAGALCGYATPIRCIQAE